MDSIKNKCVTSEPGEAIIDYLLRNCVHLGSVPLADLPGTWCMQEGVLYQQDTSFFMHPQFSKPRLDLAGRSCGFITC